MCRETSAREPARTQSKGVVLLLPRGCALNYVRNPDRPVRIPDINRTIPAPFAVIELERQRKSSETLGQSFKLMNSHVHFIAQRTDSALVICCSCVRRAGRAVIRPVSARHRRTNRRGSTFG